MSQKTQHRTKGKFYDLTGLRTTIDKEIRDLGSVFSMPVPEHVKERLYNRRLLHICSLLEPYHDDKMIEELNEIKKQNGTAYNHKLFATIMRLHKRLNFGLREGGKTREPTSAATVTNIAESANDD